MRTQLLKRLCILAALGLGLLTAPARAGQANATAAIVFKGTSTLHDFEGTVATRPFVATFHEDAATGQLRVTTKAALNVLDMNTDNKSRDKKMFKMLQQEKFAVIAGMLDDAIVPKEGSREEKLRLSICGVEQEVTATLSDFGKSGDQIICRMSFDVSLKAFGLKPPAVMGVIRVGDAVHIECKIQGMVQ